ncbi:M20/M25/M40 family metallo-hydrolase [Gordonia sp. SID5947]|uniref:dipeptidase n=1 Tax=Gordonia sp. SID5947 TaxID=2690315 RepID=UPI0013685D24|nr:dipeptidase [Gordonia sp. SID5947]MYR07910.1 M20/M25/M40 family metallo-hydrolase [Gordonia sp. SID5947]
MSDEALRDRVHDLMPRAQADLTEMVGFRSVHDAAQSPPEECDKMVDWLLEAFSSVGLADVAAHETSDGSKAVTGSLSGPDDAPTVLLYFHHDVQPPLDDAAWDSPVWSLTERSGRWYGRGAADCKGNIATHLTALRALDGDIPVNIKIIGEGSEEQGTGGLEDFVPKNPELLSADAILVCDAGNFAVGRPSLTTSLRGIANIVVTVETLSSAMHSGMFGGAAPDALAALIAMLASLRDADGNTTVAGLQSDAMWDGVDYPADAFRRDATVLDGVDLVGTGRVSDMVWARPAATVLGIDCPPVVGSSAAVQAKARARINLRVPPGMNARHAQDALIAHLQDAAPWNVKVSFEREADGSPFTGSTSGPGFDTMVDAMKNTYGTEVLLQGQGGSIPLCNVFAETFPDAEIMLLGVEEPLCLIHAPNESVDPTEIENMAVVEAKFLRDYPARLSRS